MNGIKRKFLRLLRGIRLTLLRDSAAVSLPALIVCLCVPVLPGVLLSVPLLWRRVFLPGSLPVTGMPWGLFLFFFLLSMVFYGLAAAFLWGQNGRGPCCRTCGCGNRYRTLLLLYGCVSAAQMRLLIALCGGGMPFLFLASVLSFLLLVCLVFPAVKISPGAGWLLVPCFLWDLVLFFSDLRMLFGS